MAAEPGWYDAGVPGRLRWWDGTQWTAHEHVVAVSVAGHTDPGAVPASSPASAAVPADGGGDGRRGVPMGWYVFPPTGRARWWDGERWTGFRIGSNDLPGSDITAVEPPQAAWLIIGAMVLGLLAQVGRLARGDMFALVLAVLFLAVALLVLSGVFIDLRRRRVPAPETAPVLRDDLGPLPGEVEGPGAGWHPVARRVSRWWTGARWAPYIDQRGRPVPTLTGAAVYRAVSIIVLVVAAILALVVVLGIVMLFIAPQAGIFLIILGGIVLAVLLFAYWTMRARRFAVLLPEGPPAG